MIVTITTTTKKDKFAERIRTCAGVPFSRILEAAVLAPAVRQRAQRAVTNLLHAFGCTMLQQGLFQADPHAGNLLLQVRV